MKHVWILAPVTEEYRQLFQNAAQDLELSLHFAVNPDADALLHAAMIIGNPPLSIVKQSTTLEFLQLTSAGTGDYCAAVKPGVILANASGGYGLAISEHMLGMTLALMKHLTQYRDNQNQNVWQDAGTVCSIYGAQTLVVGLGDIGGEYAKRMCALGSHVVGIRRTVGEKPNYVEAVYTLDDLDALLCDADIVALSLPETPQTRGLFDATRISKMKDGAILLNVGRGSAIDTSALIAALQSGKLAGAGLDVTDPEPLPPDHPLWQCKNALITPHVSGGFHLEETLRRILKLAAHNMKVHFSGTGELRSVVDLATGYRKATR